MALDFMKFHMRSSGFSPVAGPSAASQIEKETTEKANNEYRTRNNECRSKVFYHSYFLKRLSVAIPHFIIRNFLFDILWFAVQTRFSFTRAPPLAASVQSDQNKNFYGSVPTSVVVGFRISQ
jgi:hypothetical protein